jgi:hypothetical protein
VSQGDGGTVDVWIDDQDRVVKVQGSRSDGGADITFEVTAFGVTVDVTAPPAEDVVGLPGHGGAGSPGVI